MSLSNLCSYDGSFGDLHSSDPDNNLPIPVEVGTSPYQEPRWRA